MNRTLWILVGVVAFATVLASPLFLIPFSNLGSIEWQTVGNIGQTYSFAATILSGGALIGIVVTLRQQAQQIRIAQLQTVRSMQFELVRMAMDDPAKYGRYWGGYQSGDESQFIRDGYINQVLNYARTGIALNAMSDSGVRAIAADLFAGAPGRAYWRSSRAGWLAQSASTASDRKFFALVDTEYVEATRDT